MQKLSSSSTSTVTILFQHHHLSPGLLQLAQHWAPCFCPWLLDLFPPSSQYDLSTPLVRWHLSSVRNLSESASPILSPPDQAPFFYDHASYPFLLAPSTPTTLAPCCSLDVPSMLLLPQDICTCFPLCLGCSTLRYLYGSCLAFLGCLLSCHLS